MPSFPFRSPRTAADSGRIAGAPAAASPRGPRFALLATLVAVASIAPAAAAPYRAVMPGVARGAGAAGTFFVTDLVAQNPSATTVDLRLTFVPTTGEPATVVQPIAAGATFASDDLVDRVFGRSAAAGYLVVEADRRLLVRGASRNAAAEAGYTASLPLFDDGRLQAAGTWHALWVDHRRDLAGGFRTNVAVTFPDAAGGSATLRLVGASGEAVGSRTLEAAAPAFLQFPAGELFPGETGSFSGRLELTVTRGRAAGYLSVVDNVTGDASVFPFEPFPAEGWGVDLPGTARAAGANGTWWRTDLRLFNPSDEPVSIAATHVPRGAGAVPTTTNIVLAGGELRETTDLLGGLFGLPDGTAGSVSLVAAGPFLLAAKTSNVDPSGERPGSYGARIVPVPLSRFDDATVDGVSLPGIAPAGTDRTNVGFGAGAAGVRATARLVDAAGAPLATAAIVLGPSENAQVPLPSLFPGVPIPAGAGAEFTVADGSFHAWASTVDGESGDPVVVPADAKPCETHAPMVMVSGGGTFCDRGAAEVEIPVTLIGSAPFEVIWSDGAVQLIDDPTEDRHVKIRETTEFSITSAIDRCQRAGSAIGSALFTAVPCR